MAWVEEVESHQPWPPHLLIEFHSTPVKLCLKQHFFGQNRIIAWDFVSKVCIIGVGKGSDFTSRKTIRIGKVTEGPKSQSKRLVSWSNPASRIDPAWLFDGVIVEDIIIIYSVPGLIVISCKVLRQHYPRSPCSKELLLRTNIFGPPRNGSAVRTQRHLSLLSLKSVVNLNFLRRDHIEPSFVKLGRSTGVQFKDCIKLIFQGPLAWGQLPQ